MLPCFIRACREPIAGYASQLNVTLYNTSTDKITHVKIRNYRYKLGCAKANTLDKLPKYWCRQILAIFDITPPKLPFLPKGQTPA